MRSFVSRVFAFSSLLGSSNISMLLRAVAIVVLALACFQAAAQVPYLVKDINPGVDLSSSSPQYLTAIGNWVFFAGTDPLHGNELWKSDGTEAGTVLVKDICQSTTYVGSSPAFLRNVNGVVFFTANDCLGHGAELWKSDGTEAGTVMVKDISLAGSSSPQALTNVNGVLLFFANDGVHGTELWRSDGTEQGTVLVKDIFPGASGSYLSGYYDAYGLGAAVDGTFFFVANDGVHGAELWKSDGTESGTMLVREIYPGTSTTVYPMSLTGSNSILFFAANDTINGWELWRSDGTEAGTYMVKNIYEPYSTTVRPDSLVDVNGTLYFTAVDGNNDARPIPTGHGRELWKSDGTAAGTVMVADIYPGSGGSYPKYLTNVNGTLYFQAQRSPYGTELWKSDGTAAGTVLVKDIYSTNYGSSYPYKFANVNGTVFFVADDGVHGYELWKSDGTEAGTMLVKDLNPAGVGSSQYAPAELIDVNGTLYFRGHDGVNGYELWKSDGTEAGTFMVKNISVDVSSFAKRAIDVNGTVFFQATDGVHGSELWKTDGTEPGTVMVKDINPGTADSLDSGTSVGFMANVNGTLFFRANDSSNNAELWKSDGTAAGTVMVKDINAVNGPSGPYPLLNLNGLLLFTVSFATDPNAAGELWRSDGTEAGTVLVKDIYAGTGTSYPTSLTVINGLMFFSANNGTNGYELWISDGTLNGTVMVKDINSGTGNSSPAYFTDMNGLVYFAADDGVHGTELWRTDGSEAGTVLVKDIYPGPTRGSVYNLTNVNGTLFFRADDGVYGSELWKSDGTEAGTVLVKDINPGANGSSPQYLTAANGTLLFAANDGANGTELWTSDGTEEGTVLVADISTGESSSKLSSFMAVKGMLFFKADDGSYGYELWRSDGTAAGTMMVADINPGGASSSPNPMAESAGRLFFAADDGIHGSELWALAVNGPPYANKAALSTDQNKPVTITLSATDPENDPLTYSISAPAHGTLSGSGPDVTYTPDPYYYGPDSFTFSVMDVTGNHSKTATVSITVIQTVQPAILSFGPLTFDYDGSPKTVSVVSTPPGIEGIDVTYDGLSAPPANAGSYSVQASLANPWYTANPINGTEIIRKAAATVTLGNLTHTYDGSPKSATAITNPSGLPVTFTYSGSRTPPIAVGSYTVVATVTDANYAGSATGTLVINGSTPTIVLAAAVKGKTGPANARVWAIAVTNSGTGTAVAARLNSFTLTQTFGTACNPVIGTAFPLVLGDIGPGGSKSGNVTINFTGCAPTARFTLKVTYSESGGKAGSSTFYNQFQ